MARTAAAQTRLIGRNWLVSGLVAATLAMAGATVYVARLSPPSLARLAVGRPAHRASHFSQAPPRRFTAAPPVASGLGGPEPTTAATAPPTSAATVPVTRVAPGPVSSTGSSTAPPGHPYGPPPGAPVRSVPVYGDERTRGARGGPALTSSTTVPALVIVATLTYTVHQGDTMAQIGQWFADNGEGPEFRAHEASIERQLRPFLPGTLISISNGEVSVQRPGWPPAGLRPVHGEPPGQANGGA